MREDSFLNCGESVEEELPAVVLDFEEVANNAVAAVCHWLPRRADHVRKLIEALLAHNHDSRLQKVVDFVVEGNISFGF